MKTKITSVVHDAIRSAKDSLKRDRASIVARARAMRAAEPTIRAIVRWLGDLATDNGSSINAWTDMSTLRTDATGSLRVVFNLYGLTGFKDDPRLLKALEKADEVASSLSITEPKIETRDWPSCMNRDYSFRFEVGSLDVELVVGAYVREDSPTCKRVQTGVETHTVEKYELVCQ